MAAVLIKIEHLVTFTITFVNELIIQIERTRLTTRQLNFKIKLFYE